MLFSNNINIWVDDQPCISYSGYTIMQSCSSYGIDIPKFCYHENLLIAGNCRICLVEVSGSKKLVASCAAHVGQNISVYTNTVRVRLARQNVLEFLLANHPLDCPICDQGGECDLQDITLVFGSDRGRFYEEEKRSVLNKDFGPLIRTSMNRCIHCTRCVRFLSHVSGGSILGTLGRGKMTEIGLYINKFIYDELSGNITDLCPVGALTSKPFSFRARSWELTSIESLDIFDTVNSNLSLEVAYNKIVRVLPYFNDLVNEDWITNKARYSYDGLFLQRLDSCFLRVSTITLLSGFTNEVNCCASSNLNFFLFLRFVKISWSAAINFFLDFSLSETLNRFYFFIGGLCDVETVFSAKLAGNLMGAKTVSYFLNTNLYNFSSDFSYSFLFNTSLRAVSTAPSFILFILANPRFEAPLLNMKLTRLFEEFLVPFYAVSSPLYCVSYKVFSISSNILGFFNILEFKNNFCKLFYFEKFFYQPLIILGSALSDREDSASFLNGLFLFFENLFCISSNIFKYNFFFSVKRDLYFSYFGFLHLYSGRIHSFEFGLVGAENFYNYFKSLQKDSLVLKRSFLFYSVGVESYFLNQLKERYSAGSWFVIYQGSHGGGFSTFANLILPVSSYVERNTIYKNLNGLSQSSSLILTPFNKTKDDTAVFRLLWDEGFLKLDFFFFKLGFFKGISYCWDFLRLKTILNDNLILFSNINARFLNAFSENLSFYLSYSNKNFFSFFKTLIFARNFKKFCIFRLGLNSSDTLNYYGDATNVVVRSSKIMNTCSNIFLKKNFSFSKNLT